MLFCLSLIFLIISSSCSYYRVATVSTENVKSINSLLLFENDTVRITYNFWALKGLMSFDIYNKLNIPIYFDWKKSAFIPNDRMMSYWQDEVNTEGTSSGSTFYYYGSVSSSSKLKSKSIRQERVGVVPPHSMINSSKYILAPRDIAMKSDAEYSLYNSPLRFRNYLAISSKEQFDNDVMYIDNSFFVSYIQRVKKSKINSYKHPNSFYIPYFVK
jgi:hypothetical protein